MKSSSKLDFFIRNISGLRWHCLVGYTSTRLTKKITHQKFYPTKNPSTPIINSNYSINMPPSRTPIFDSRERQKHYTTPVKAKVQGAVEFCERMGISYYKEEVFRTFDVSREQGYACLRNDSARRLEKNSDAEETRGRKSLITPKQIREMERILETEGIEGRGLTWSQLGYEIGLDCNGRTIQRAMGTMDYHKCLSCRRGWVNNKTAAHRVEWA